MIRARRVSQTVPRQWQGRPSKLDAFKPYLDDRWTQGCTNAWTVWEEIVVASREVVYGFDLIRGFAPASE
ncbi:hypothetical protein [Streptomyces sp. NPDC017964]|uniref:hypothetical protein n=1 Tax=Streptomyces sp. NPDC017964 TaxID=3365022 RepID=UPI0037BB3E80